MGSEYGAAGEKRTLEDKLMAIVLLETSKPYKEMDSDLVVECVDFLMELKEKERITQQEIERRVSEIPFIGKVYNIRSKAKMRLRLKRLGIVAAVLALIFSVFSIAAVAMGETPLSLLRRMPYILVEMFNGESRNVDNFTIIKDTESRSYSSVEELAKEENISILSPTWLPEGKEITSVVYVDSGISKRYILSCNDSVYGVEVILEKSVTAGMKTNINMKVINELTVYYEYCEDVDFWQASFDRNCMLYAVKAQTEEELFKIIESLKEIS